MVNNSKDCKCNGIGTGMDGSSNETEQEYGIMINNFHIKVYLLIWPPII